MSHQPPAISFIIPIYNIQNYLSQAIESVLKQSVTKEIILIDDGSTDNSLHIALDYAKREPSISIIHSQNQGISHARNLGLRLAQGEFIHFLDADDILDEQIDLKQLYHFAKQQQLHILRGQYKQYHIQTPQNFTTSQPILGTNQSHHAHVTSLHHFLAIMLNTTWQTIQIGCFLIDRQWLIHQRIQFNEQFNYAEDLLFQVDLLACEGKIAELDLIFMHYRNRENSADSIQQLSLNRIMNYIYTIEQLVFKAQNCPQQELQALLWKVSAIVSYHVKLGLQYLPTEFTTLWQSFITQEIRVWWQKFGWKIS